MKQIELLRDVGNDFERALFAAAEREPIPLSSKQEVARRLGIAVASARPAASVPAASGIARSVWGKLTFLAAVGGLGFVWGGSLLGNARPADGTAANLGSVVTAPSRTTIASAAPALEAQQLDLPPSVAVESTSHATNDGAATTVAAEEAPRSTHLRREARSASVSATRHIVSPNRSAPASASLGAASDSNGDGLLREVRSLDAVRAALRAHDGVRALERLDVYASEFPQGELAIESQVLRVSALVQTEQRAAARSLALRTLGVPGSTRYRTELEHSLQALERPTTTE